MKIFNKIFVSLSILIILGIPLLAQESTINIITDSHVHTGFINNQDTIAIKELDYFSDRGINIFIYAMPVNRSETKNLLSRITEEVRQIKKLAENNSFFDFAKSMDQIEHNIAKEKISALLGIEYFHGVFGDDIESIEEYKQLGIQYITLLNNFNDNLFSKSDKLSAFGKQVIEKMNEVGILIDISHLNNLQRLAAIEYSKAPVLASHSCTLGIAEVEGNLSNNVIKALNKNKGYVMMSFNKNDLFESDNLSDEGVEQLINHIDYLKDEIRIDHIGIGSDYQANGRYVPASLNKQDVFKKIFRAMTLRGYKNSEIYGVLGGNILKSMD